MGKERVHYKLNSLNAVLSWKIKRLNKNLVSPLYIGIDYNDSTVVEETRFFVTYFAIDYTFL